MKSKSPQPPFPKGGLYRAVPPFKKGGWPKAGGICLAVVGSLLSACATPEVAVNAHADFSKIHRVAVTSFGGPAGDVAADLLTQDLLRHGADVVERQRLEALLNEQHLAANKELDPKTVKQIGKILGVDAIFVGTVADNVPSQSYLVTHSRRGGGYGGYNTVTPVGSGNVTAGPAVGIPHADVVTSAAQNSLIARMVDVETGSVLWSGRMSYEGYDNQSAMAAITRSFAKSLVPLWPAIHP
jgi:curli biogenesis system outer membrane secretion channel CsgG